MEFLNSVLLSFRRAVSEIHGPLCSAQQRPNAVIGRYIEGTIDHTVACALAMLAIYIIEYLCTFLFVDVPITIIMLKWISQIFTVAHFYRFTCGRR